MLYSEGRRSRMAQISPQEDATEGGNKSFRRQSNSDFAKDSPNSKADSVHSGDVDQEDHDEEQQFGEIRRRQSSEIVVESENSGGPFLPTHKREGGDRRCRKKPTSE